MGWERFGRHLRVLGAPTCFWREGPRLAGSFPWGLGERALVGVCGRTEITVSSFCRPRHQPVERLSFSVPSVHLLDGGVPGTLSDTTDGSGTLFPSSSFPGVGYILSSKLDTLGFSPLSLWICLCRTQESVQTLPSCLSSLLFRSTGAEGERKGSGPSAGSPPWIRDRAKFPYVDRGFPGGEGSCRTKWD